MNKKNYYNKYGQKIGYPVVSWQASKAPEKNVLIGRECRLEPIDASKHVEAMYTFFGPASAPQTWTYLPMESFATKAALLDHLHWMECSEDPFFYAIIDQKSNQAVGVFALMRKDCANGSIEVGSVIYSERLRHTRMATEAQYLLACYVFDTLGYRRYEWKCDSFNQPSRKAAQRLGFTFEGVFRQAVVYKGRNRDTAWFSIIDQEWPRRKRRLEKWLVETNFTDEGKQKRRLEEL